MKQAQWTRLFAAVGEESATERIERMAVLAKDANPNPDADLKTLQKARDAARTEAGRNAMQAEIDALAGESELSQQDLWELCVEAANLAGLSMGEFVSKAITKAKGDYVHPVKQRLDIVGLKFEEACEKLGINPEEL